MDKQYTITKKIAKHGTQSIIIIPSFLQEQLCPGRLVELQIKMIKTED